MIWKDRVSEKAITSLVLELKEKNIRNPAWPTHMPDTNATGIDLWDAPLSIQGIV